MVFIRLICLLFALTSTTSCTFEQESKPTAQKTESNSDLTNDSGTNGALIPITSNNVIAAGYDIQSKTMKVQFKNGFIFEYYGVDLELWNSFVESQPNPWSRVGYPRLIGEGYQYRRIY